MEKEDLLEILGIVNRYALTSPLDGGPKDDEDYDRVSRLNWKLTVALRALGVRLKEVKYPLVRGILALWTAEPGSGVDVKA